MVGSCCSLRDGSAGRTGEERYGHLLRNAAAVQGGMEGSVGRQKWALLQSPFSREMPPCSCKEGRNNLKYTANGTLLDFLRNPVLLEMEFSQGFKQEELNLDAEGCQELAEDSVSSAVADSSSSAVKRHLLVYELLLCVSRSIAARFKPRLVHLV